MKQRPNLRWRKFAVATLCLAAAASGFTEPLALANTSRFTASGVTRPVHEDVPKIIAGAQLGGIVSAPTGTSSPPDSGGVVSALRRSSLTIKRDSPQKMKVEPTPSRTIMGGGNPATWPATKPNPPSLAAAYSPNAKTSFVCLVRYSDWLGSHPSPSLVKNYVSPTSNIYKPQLYLMRELVAKGWHEAADPTEIQLLKVVKSPDRRRFVHTKANASSGDVGYSAGVIDVVINQKKEPYLNKAGVVVGYSNGGGPTAWRITLLQNRSNGEFRIGGYERLKMSGSPSVWEKEL
jgi:hypothetical protein